jgi:hypothetical protein
MISICADVKATRKEKSRGKDMIVDLLGTKLGVEKIVRET